MPEVTQSAGEKAGTGDHSSLIPGSALSRVSEGRDGRDGGPGWHCILFPGPSTDVAHSGCSWLGGSGQKLPWSRAAAALPSLGPRWRCAHSVSLAPAGLHLQLRTQGLGRCCSVPPASSACSLLDQSSSYPAVPLAEADHHGGTSGWASSPSPPCCEREGGTHCVPSQTRKPTGSGAQGQGRGDGARDPSLPALPFPVVLGHPPHPPTPQKKPGVAIYKLQRPRQSISATLCGPDAGEGGRLREGQGQDPVQSTSQGRWELR